jgi:hypothetical protein
MVPNNDSVAAVLTLDDLENVGMSLEAGKEAATLFIACS